MPVKILTLRQYCENFEACEANAGEVRLCSGIRRDGTLTQGIVICHKHYNKYTWTSLDKLSKSNKLKFADKIEVAFRNHCISQNLDVDMGAGTYYAVKVKCDRLKVELRELKELHSRTNTFFIKQLEKKTCVMEGCPGMCARDFDEYNPEGFEVCFCCKKTQELECPICYESRKVSDMVCGSNCSHHICWKCYGMADRGGNKIEKCPMCRANF